MQWKKKVPLARRQQQVHSAFTRTPCTLPPQGKWTHSKHARTRTHKILHLTYQWLRGRITLQSLVPEYIEVIFVVSQELVYQQGDKFIFAEVSVHIVALERLPACDVHMLFFPWTCLCVLFNHRPNSLNNRAKWVSIPFLNAPAATFKGELHLKQQQNPCVWHRSL